MLFTAYLITRPFQVKLFWKEVREDLIPASVTKTIWDELPKMVIDTQKIEHLFESRAKDLMGKVIHESSCTTSNSNSHIDQIPLFQVIFSSHHTNIYSHLSSRQSEDKNKNVNFIGTHNSLLHFFNSLLPLHVCGETSRSLSVQCEIPQNINQ